MTLTEQHIDHVIEMAWEDRTPFEAIKYQFDLSEPEVIELMRREIKGSSFIMWRKRVLGRGRKQQILRTFEEGHFKCSRQKQITPNSISKH